jgi:hypothetical protein
MAGARLANRHNTAALATAHEAAAETARAKESERELLLGID